MTRYCKRLRCSNFDPCSAHPDEEHSLACATEHKQVATTRVSHGAVIISHVERLAHLENLPRGVAVVSYGGGGDFRSAKNLMQVKLNPAKFPVHAIVEAFGQLDPNSLEPHVLEAMSTEWRQSWSLENAIWESTLALSSRVKGASRGDFNAKINLYFHGFLFADTSASASSGLKFPLVGVFSPSKGMLPYVAEDAMGQTASAGFGSFRPADQHFHGVDPWAGGTKESFRLLLLESGMSEEDADTLILVEEATANDKYLGSDSARVLLEPLPLCWCWVCCIDTASPQKRVLASLLLVVDENLEKLAEGAESDLRKILQLLQTREPLAAQEIEKVLGL